MRGFAIILSWAAIWALLSLPVTGVHLHLHSQSGLAPTASQSVAHSDHAPLHVVHAFDAQHSDGMNLGDHQDVQPDDTPLGKLTAAILLALFSSYLAWSVRPLRLRLPPLLVARPPLRYRRPLAQAPPSPI
jgi:hypothetical protein